MTIIFRNFVFIRYPKSVLLFIVSFTRINVTKVLETDTVDVVAFVRRVFALRTVKENMIINIDWLIDYRLASRKQYFSYILYTTKKKNNIKISEVIGQPGQRLSTATGKLWELSRDE